MRRAAAVLVLALAGAGLLAATSFGGTSGAGGRGILFLRTPPNNGRVQHLYLWHAGSAHALGPSKDWILEPQWAPDGKSIAFADERGGWDDPDATDIFVMSAGGTGLRQLTDDSKRDNVFREDSPSWSPNGRRIVYVRETENSNELAVVDLRSGRERTLPAGRGLLKDPAWGKAGIAYGNGSGAIMLLNPAGGRPKVLARGFNSLLAWSSRGVLAAHSRGGVVLYTAAGRQVGFVPIHFLPKTRVCGLAWSPDGKSLVIRTARKDVGLWTATITGRRWRRLPVTTGTSNIDNCAVSWR